MITKENFNKIEAVGELVNRIKTNYSKIKESVYISDNMVEHFNDIMKSKLAIINTLVDSPMINFSKARFRLESEDNYSKLVYGSMGSTEIIEYHIVVFNIKRNSIINKNEFLLDDDILNPTSKEIFINKLENLIDGIVLWFMERHGMDCIYYDYIQLKH